MKTRLLLTLLLTFSCYLLSSQVPQGFNYQAIARSSNGKEIVNTALKVRISVLTDTTGFFSAGSGSYVWEEEHNITTNSFGLFSLIAGNPSATKVQGSAASFSAINWNVNPLFLGAKIYYQGSWLNMGTSIFGSVPYSIVTSMANTAKKLSPGNKINGINFDGSGPITLPANSLSGSFEKIAVAGAATSPDSALFEVKNKNGQTVFAVYPEAVNIYVPKGAKGTKGGFAIGGFESVKGTPQDYFRVTSDSVRIYIDNNPPTGKGSTKGGFAIGGFDASKGALPNYFMNVTGANAVNTVDSASQILWYPNKQAFLAGRISISSSDSVGTNSTSLGYKSRAIGNYSQAFGYKTTARGDYSTAIGKLSVAGSRAAGISTASNAFAFGNAAVATGNDSYALGSGASASGFRSFAFGSVGLDDAGNPTSTPTTASQPYTFAIGMGAQATQKGAMAIGLGALSSGYYSNSFGYYSISSAYYSTALGFRSAATNNYSGAFGYYAKADGIGSLALGNRAWAVSNYSTAVGDSAKTQADYASAFGRMAKAKAPSSVAVGYNAQTSASATDAGAFGKNSIANGPYSAALGTSTFTGDMASYSTAIGYGSNTTGSYATALGYFAQANGNKSLSIGSYYSYTFYRFIYNPVTRKFTVSPVPVTKYNIASDDYSVAIGNGNTVTKGGLGVGSNNYARAFGAVAIGHSNTADSSYSFAAGYSNNALGLNAFALGESIISRAKNCVAVGSYNVDEGDPDTWIDTDPIFVVGNGTSSARSDALKVLKNGTLVLPQLAAQVMSGYWLFIDANGNVMKSSSSLRYKTNVNSISDVSWLYELNPVNFAYKSDPGKAVQTGLIAEEVEKVNRQFVLYEHGIPESVNYPGLMAPMIKAIQDQKKTIETLKSENELLRERLEKLESKISDILQNQK